AKVHDDPKTTNGRPGSRAPHIWLTRGGKKISSLDLFGSGFVLLAGPQGNTWREAWRAIKNKFPGLPFGCLVVGQDVQDSDGRFLSAFGIASDGASLIRPDGFVGWRSKTASTDPAAALEQALKTLLAKG
ncbi:MAG TPA: monooxygenase, partial [Xanthobacteraceae bacterium]|nr:monooxygenase [Xanthobacteraceae bacterium]